MVKKRNTVKTLIDLLASKVSLLILSAITVWLGISAAKEMYQKHEARVELDRLKAEIIALERKNSNLASLMDPFKDPENIELEAKKRLNLKKPGEEVAVILRDKNDETQNIIQGENEISALNGPDDAASRSFFTNPAKWWQYITNN